MHKQSKYTNSSLKQIGLSIEQLDNHQHYIEIFNILLEDDNNKYTENSNGVFLNLSAVADDTLDKIVSFLKTVNTEKYNNSHTHINTVPTSMDIHRGNKRRTYKLSNCDKNILNQQKKSEH